MAKKSKFSFFTSGFSADATTFLNLEYEKQQTDQKDLTDLSRLELLAHNFSSPDLKIQKDQSKTPQIPLIAVGGAGIRLLDQVVRRIEGYGMKYSTMAIDTHLADLKSNDNISHKYHIPGSDLGTGHQLRIAATRARRVEEKITEEIKTYLADMNVRYKHEIVFLLMGAGGTGVGAGIEIARILIEMGKRPVPFLLLPTREEMSRIKFNAAVALYYFSYAPGDRCLNLTSILIDNEEFVSENNKKYYSSVIAASNERIAAALGDIIVTTELESHAYSADLNEFLEIFRELKGIGTLCYIQVEKPSRPIAEYYDKYSASSLSINVDVSSATRSYFYVSTRSEEITAEEYRNLMLSFGNSDVFNKLHELEPNDDDFIAIRGIFTGVDYSDRVISLMQHAEDARVEILNKELKGQKSGKVNPKIDRLDGEDEIDVKTGQELREERAGEYAKMQREGGKP